MRAWRVANRSRKAALNAAYKASKIQAAPKWLTKDQKAEMREVYALAAAITAHVDHIVPLRGKDVCGLHVPWNLQLLSPEENMRKGNKNV